MLGLLSLSPPYTAVMKCGLPATSKLAVAYVAVPLLSTAAVPNSVELSTKVTVPVGRTELIPFHATVAVKLTASPNCELGCPGLAAC